MKIRTKSNGYVALVRCGGYHSGNRGLAGPVNGHYACQGCGQFFSRGDVELAQESALANRLRREIGAGGLVAA